MLLTVFEKILEVPNDLFKKAPCGVFFLKVVKKISGSPDVELLEMFKRIFETPCVLFSLVLGILGFTFGRI